MPAATRIGDWDLIHCSVPSRMGGSPNVFVNGIPWSRQGDLNTVHLKPVGCPPCCIPHVAPISSGSTTVRVNGLGAGRVGDMLMLCTMVIGGSPNVMAGG